MKVSLQERFRGCLIGLAVGDALGGRFEAQSAEHIQSRIASVDQLINYATDELWYTDDTQMTIGVAETLVEHREIIEPHLCRAFVANYVPSRGYGRGARAVLSAMEAGEDYQRVAAMQFPGGSFGNGAAMRVAPVGLFFRDDESKIVEQAQRSALPTHVHPLGIEGAQLLALAVAYASRVDDFERDDYFTHLIRHAHSPQFRDKLSHAAKIQSRDGLSALGNGIEALESVPTAIASFALSPHSYEETIASVIFLGGDTDTLAAMAGAISGSFLGMEAVPRRLFNWLENSPKGRDYLVELSGRLFQAATSSA